MSTAPSIVTPNTTMPNRNRGAALLIALFIAALASVTATSLMWRQQLWLKQHQQRSDYAQARTLVIAGADWAKLILRNDALRSSVDHLGEEWAIRLPAIPVENGEISGFIVDQQGLFNFNNLFDKDQSIAEQTKFRRLLAILQLPGELAEATYFSQALLRYAELAESRGFTATSRQILQPYLSTLPRTTPLNVNTAPAEVLAAAIEGLQLEEARKIVAERRVFYDLNAFRARLPRPHLRAANNEFTVQSQFYFLNITARQGTTRVYLQALVQREGTSWPKTIWQTIE